MRLFSGGRVNITAVENPVENVEKASGSRKKPVDNSVERVDKKLHSGCQNNLPRQRGVWNILDGASSVLQEERRED